MEPILIRAKSVPVITSFGVISERTSLLIRAEDTDGAVGWGEVFGNFPIHSAENQNISLRTTLPHWRYLKPESPVEVFNTLTTKTHVLALQSNPVPLHSL